MVGFGIARKIHLLVLILALAVLGPVAVHGQSASPHLVVNTYRLNVRSGPGVEHGIITTVAGGTELAVSMIGAGGTWYEVTSPAGIGWVHSNFTIGRGDFSAVPRAGTPTNLAAGTGNIAAGAAHVVVNTSYLNIRSGPGIDNNIVTVVPGGTTLAVTALDSSGKWYQVETSVGSGWLHSGYVAARGDFTSVRREGQPVQIDTADGGEMRAEAPNLVVNTSYLNVRSGPGAGHDIITVVAGGTQLPVTLIAPDRKWYQVTTSDGAGWVHSGYTLRRGDFSGVPVAVDPLTGSVPRAVVNTYRLNIRSGPGVGHNVVATVPGGTTLAVLGLSSDRDWYLVEGDFGQGWLNNFYAAFRGDISQVQVVS